MKPYVGDLMIYIINDGVLPGILIPGFLYI